MAEIRRVQPNLVPGARYVVRVRSINSFNVSSEWSESISFQALTDDTIPGAPANVQTNFTSSALVITWDPPATNSDGSSIVDLRGYEVRLVANSITKIYVVTDNLFIYTKQQNEEDFTTIQSSIQVSVRSVDVNGNYSAWVDALATNLPPTNPTQGPILAGVFDGINVTMIPPGNISDFSGFYLEHALSSGGPWSLLADIENDTYFHELGTSDTDIHYYRFKVRDVFGQLSAGYSPVSSAQTIEIIDSIDDITVPDDYITSDMIGELTVSKVRTGTIETYAGNATVFTIDAGGYIQSVGYADGGAFPGTPVGYQLKNTGLVFQNGAIQIVGHSVGGTSAIDLDTSKFRVAYGGNSRFYVDSSGIYFNGTTTSNANLYVTSAGVMAFQTSSGTHTFMIDSSATGSNKYLTLYPTGSPSTPTFYLTADGTGYFGKGVIGIGDGVGAFNVDAAGNIWQGTAASYATATGFRVSKLGQINTGSGTTFQVTTSGAVTASNVTITGGSLTIGGTFSVTTGGVLTASGASITGAINATSGTIGGWTINASTLTGGGVTLSSSGTISGGTITGSTFRTSSSGNRVQIYDSASTGFVNFYTGHASETTEGYIRCLQTTASSSPYGQVIIRSPAFNGQSTGAIFVGGENASGSFKPYIEFATDTGGTVNVNSDNFTWNGTNVASEAWVFTQGFLTGIGTTNVTNLVYKDSDGTKAVTIPKFRMGSESEATDGFSTTDFSHSMGEAPNYVLITPGAGDGSTTATDRVAWVYDIDSTRVYIVWYDASSGSGFSGTTMDYYYAVGEPPA